MKVLLVVVLGVEEGRFGRRTDFRRDLAFAPFAQFARIFGLGGLRLAQLRFGVSEDARSARGRRRGIS